MLYEHIERLSGPLGKVFLCHSVKKNPTWTSVTWKIKLLRSARRGCSSMCSRHSAIHHPSNLPPQPLSLGRISLDAPVVTVMKPACQVSSDRNTLKHEFIWMIQHEQWTHRTLTLPRCLYGPRSWAALASSCFGHQVLKHHYCFSSHMFFRPKNVFTNRLNV